MFHEIIAEINSEHEYMGDYIDCIHSTLEVRMLTIAFKLHALEEEKAMHDSRYLSYAEHKEEHARVIESYFGVPP